jgi:alkanesulfonate monooxygenase SsuD/methylene tetrahydromethanopterin reductase-like flavin-dependent oxidoreductase (luciferase family)
MDFFANMIRLDVDPAGWAAAREREGWAGVVCSDHYWTVTDDPNRGNPHVWVTLATMAAHTSAVRLAPSFANNLLRSPVEFAQAMLCLQRDSGGRAEAGLGAGWYRDELEATGQRFPDPPERAGRLREALQIVRALLDTGTCEFEGRHYTVRVPRMGPLVDPPPPLVASVGGPWTIRNITPLVDRVEVSAAARATRGGDVDIAALAAVTRDEVRGMIEAVREVRANVPVGMLVHFAVGDTPQVADRKRLMGDGFLSGFIGEPTAVAQAVHELRDLGIDRVQLTEIFPGGVEQLAPALLTR